MRKIIGGLTGLLLSASAIASPIEFDISAPKNVQPNVPFSVSVIPNEPTTEEYDLKLSPEKDGSRVNSELYNPEDSEWQSTYYYLSNSFPSHESYNLNITEEDLVGETLNLNAILRDSSNNKYTATTNVNVVPEPFILPALLAPALLFKKRRE